MVLKSKASASTSKLIEMGFEGLLACLSVVLVAYFLSGLILSVTSHGLQMAGLNPAVASTTEAMCVAFVAVAVILSVLLADG